MGAHQLDDSLAGWREPHGTHVQAIDNHLVIDENLELAVATVLHLNVDPQLPAQPSRHTDSM
jgi:hypothetical protein